MAAPEGPRQSWWIHNVPFFLVPAPTTPGGYEARYADLNRNFFCFSLRFLPLRFLEDAQDIPVNCLNDASHIPLHNLNFFIFVYRVYHVRILPLGRCHYPTFPTSSHLLPLSWTVKRATETLQPSSRQNDARL